MSHYPENKREDEAAGRCLPEWDIFDGICSKPSASLSEDLVSTTEETVSVMVFQVKNTWFALKTNLFHKVADIALPHTVPGRTGNCFRGIVNAGGELELCFSLADVLGIADASAEMPEGINHPRLVVIGEEDKRFAFAVDEVLGVRLISPGDLAALPATSAGPDRDNDIPVIAVDGKKVGLLNEGKLFAVLTRCLSDGDG